MCIRDRYGTEHFERQQFGTAGVEGVKNVWFRRKNKKARLVYFVGLESTCTNEERPQYWFAGFTRNAVVVPSSAFISIPNLKFPSLGIPPATSGGLTVHEAMEARASGPQFLGQKIGPAFRLSSNI